HAQGQTRAFESGFDGSGGVKDVAGGVTGTGVDQAAGLRVESAEEQGDEPFVAHVLGEDAVGAGQDFADVLAPASKDAQIGTRFGHEQGRTDSMAGDVGDDDAEAIMKHGEVIEVVAAGGFGGKGSSGDVEARASGGALGKEPLLDLARDAKLFLVFAQ